MLTISLVSGLLIFRLVCAAIVFGFLGYICYIMWDDWKNTANEDKDTLGELLRLGAGSLTKVWLRFVSLISSVLAGLSFLIPGLQLPEAHAAINKYLPPEWVAGVVLGIAVVGLLTRSRSSEDGRWL